MYADAVLGMAVDALNDIMRATRVELLVTDPTVLQIGPPPFPDHHALSQFRRARYRLLAGL